MLFNPLTQRRSRTSTRSTPIVDGFKRAGGHRLRGRGPRPRASSSRSSSTSAPPARSTSSRSPARRTAWSPATTSPRSSRPTSTSTPTASATLRSPARSASRWTRCGCGPAIPREPWSLSPLPGVDRGVEAARKGQRDCWWEPEGFTATPVYDYSAIGPGHRIEGPAVVEATDTTILIEPGWSAAMDEYGFFTLNQEA